MPTQEEIDLYPSPPSFVVGDMVRNKLSNSDSEAPILVERFGPTIPHWSSCRTTPVYAHTFYGVTVYDDGAVGSTAHFYTYPFTPVPEEEAARLRPLIKAHVKPVRKGPPTNHKIGVPKGKLP